MTITLNAWLFTAILYSLGGWLMLTVSLQDSNTVEAIFKAALWPFVMVFMIPMAIAKEKDNDPTK